MKKRAIFGEKYKEKLQIPLENLGYDCVMLPKNKQVEYQINSHADILAFITKKYEIILEPSIKLNIEHIKGDTILRKGYPNNIAYNGLLIGNKFFHNLKYTDKQILAHLKGVEIHNVNQGFSKCSVLIINDETAITSDKGMAKILIENNIEVLEISHGDIELEGYNYGFIGGCGFVDDEKNLILTGKISHHKDYKKIQNFLDERGIKIIYLTQEKIFDVGSILIVK